jgi:hypothetical protein
MLSGAPANEDVGTNSFIVAVTDEDGLSSRATVVINVNGPPVFSADPFSAPAITIGREYSGSLTNQAVDPNPGAALVFAKLSGPAWLVIAPDGSLTGIPGAADIGTNLFNVMVSDAGGLASSATMQVPVMGDPAPPNLQISFQTNLFVLSWTGGSPPFQPQVLTNLAAGSWQDFGGLISNYACTVHPGLPAAAFRIQSRVP